MAYELKDIVDLALENGHLLEAVFAHPQFNRSSPRDSPKPLYFVADFIRTTYIQYALPLLPKGALSRSRKIFNGNMFGLNPGTVPEWLPEGAEEDAWLADPNNWPREVVQKNEASRSMFVDLVGRSSMIALIITDRTKGSMIMGGEFEWDANPDIVRIAAEMNPGA